MLFKCRIGQYVQNKLGKLGCLQCSFTVYSYAELVQGKLWYPCSLPWSILIRSDQRFFAYSFYFFLTMKIKVNSDTALK